MNHLWAVTFKDAEGPKKLLALKEVTVKNRRCIVIDPQNQEVRLKLHWVLHNVPDDEVRNALEPYGKVMEVTKDRWRVQGCTAQASTTRLVALRLKAGITMDDLPHQVRVAGDQALVVVPGRAPQCLRCQQKGHVRRQCRVPRCALCRQFGHEEGNCVRTYAKVAAPASGEDIAELMMDETEAEETAGGTRVKDNNPGETKAASPDAAAAALPEEPRPRDATQSLSPVLSTDSDSMDEDQGAADEPTEVTLTNTDGEGADDGNASPVVVKRALDDVMSDGSTAAGDSVAAEPPTKTPALRRSLLRPAPSVPPERSVNGNRRT
ncbi:uncharacterized protein LOC144154751 [Haemaphysalis longicornis]